MNHKQPSRSFFVSDYGLLELIDELILLVTHLKYYDGPNCDLINIETYWLLLWEVIIK